MIDDNYRKLSIFYRTFQNIFMIKKLCITLQCNCEKDVLVLIGSEQIITN